jgi:hypothetical protein
MSAGLQLYTAGLLVAVACGCFAFVAGLTGRPWIAAVLAAVAWGLGAATAAFFGTVTQ